MKNNYAYNDFISMPKALVDANRWVREIRLSAGQVTCNSDSLCESLLIVEKGCLRVYKRASDGRTYTLYRVNAGDCCSLTISCILNNEKFPAIVEVEEDIIAYQISAKHVRQWIKEDLEWQGYIFKQLTKKVSQLTDLTDSFVFNSMDSRIAHLLCRRIKHNRVIRATHQCIASEIGTSREVVSRSLRFLESKSYVELKRGQIDVIDSKALRDFSNL